MKIQVKYFARFREITGTDSESLETDSPDISGLMNEVFRAHPDLSREKSILIALNERFADLSSSLSDGDQVAVLPPVSGG